MISIDFTTQNKDTGAAADADALPTAVLVVDNADSNVTVAVAHVALGLYRASFTPPATYAGLQLRATATVAGSTGTEVLWRQVLAPYARADVPPAWWVAPSSGAGGIPSSPTPPCPPPVYLPVGSPENPGIPAAIAARLPSVPLDGARRHMLDQQAARAYVRIEVVNPQAVTLEGPETYVVDASTPQALAAATTALARAPYLAASLDLDGSFVPVGLDDLAFILADWVARRDLHLISGIPTDDPFAVGA